MYGAVPRPRSNQSGYRRGAGPGPHWLARRRRAGFVAEAVCAPVLGCAMESGLIPRLALRLGIAEPDVLR